LLALSDIFHILELNSFIPLLSRDVVIFIPKLYFEDICFLIKNSYNKLNIYLNKYIMKNIILLKNIKLIFKIIFFMFFWFLIPPYFIYKKYKNWKLEKMKKQIIEEIERRYEKFPFKNRFTQEEIIKIIIQDIENEALYVEYLANERYKRLLYLAAIT
jgi:hypothetical protein